MEVVMSTEMSEQFVSADMNDSLAIADAYAGYESADARKRFAITEWYDRYALGVPAVDSRYQRLFFLFNTNRDGFIEYASANDPHSVFDQLIDYARYQFFAEERWMQFHLFPRLVNHEEEHAWMLTRASDIYEEFRAGIWPLSLEILDAMHLWLNSHVLWSDEEISDFITDERLNHSPRSHEFKKKTIDSAKMALNAWRNYYNQTVIGPASVSECAGKI
jgi:hemerythrin-like metal-binding protein